MAIKATIYKAQIQVSDLDRNLYGDHSVTLARHPSETDERMMIRLLAFGLHAPLGDEEPPLEFAKDIWDPDEPSLWQKDPTGHIRHWIEVGHPDERRLLRTSSRVDQIDVYAFASTTPVWWKGLETRITRLRNLRVSQILPPQSQALAALAQRTMRLQLTVQDGAIWVDDGAQSIEVTPARLWEPRDS